MAKKKKKFSIPTWAIIIICAVGALLVAGIVCLVLILSAQADDARKAIEAIDGISGTRVTVEAYFESKISEDGKISSENRSAFMEFEAAVEKAGGYLKDLDKNRFVSEGEAKEKYDEASKKMGDLQGVAEIEQLMMDSLDDGVLSDEELDSFVNSNSEYLQNLGKSYKEYRAKAKEYNEKYADLKGKNKAELDANAAAIKQMGDELTAKYKDMKFDDVYGMSRDDILKFYATIEELKTILAKKN